MVIFDIYLLKPYQTPQWEVELEFAATKVDGANKKVTYKVIADDTGDIESTIELEIFGLYFLHTKACFAKQPRI